MCAISNVATRWSCRGPHQKMCHKTLGQRWRHYGGFMGPHVSTLGPTWHYGDSTGSICKGSGPLIQVCVAKITSAASRFQTGDQPQQIDRSTTTTRYPLGCRAICFSFIEVLWLWTISRLGVRSMCRSVFALLISIWLG